MVYEYDRCIGIIFWEQCFESYQIQSYDSPAQFEMVVRSRSLCYSVFDLVEPFRAFFYRSVQTG